ncbi:metallophosphoesterase [Kribbia dieselivorans]|uniref:metallophosphoesterase n=1 Tax=Kribbia dieselivorans TaxID=331526 RepID=UPI00083817E2|nr:metallophosphoesterase [Kribbia dieselivorans]
MSLTRRQFTFAGLGLSAGVATTALAGAPLSAFAATGDQTSTSADLALLTDPFLQYPRAASVNVVWFTEISDGTHLVLVGDGVEKLTVEQVATVGGAKGRPSLTGVDIVRADDRVLSRTAEDSGSFITGRPTPAEGIVPRPVRRHEAVVRGLVPDERVPYRVASIKDGGAVLSATYTLTPALPQGAGARIMLTSDHQAMQNTPTNIEVAAATMGELDAVIFAGDLVNIPDRASEWFDDERGSAFFPVLQGAAARVDRGGHLGVGAAVIQNVPIYPAIGNHEVQGRREGMTSLGASFGAPVPRDVAKEAWKARTVRGDRRNQQQWVEDNSFSTTTYEEIFTLPQSPQGEERYYATTIGNVRLITLFSTRIWRWVENDADPVARRANSRYQEAASSLSDPLAQGYGEFVFEDLAKGSAQYEWLVRELRSTERRAAEYTIVQLHEGPHGLGDNMTPPFAHPQRVEETDAQGTVIGVRYEYSQERNFLANDLAPLLEAEGVQLVYNGHSHLWNRFTAANGVTHYLEASNTGNTYNAFTKLSGLSRHVPSAPWNRDSYPAQENPGGLLPIVPNNHPMTNAQGTPLPYVASNFHVVFQMFDSYTGELTSWIHPVNAPDQAPVVLDVFTLQPSR